MELIRTVEGARFFATFMIIAGHAMCYLVVDPNSIDDYTKLVMEHLLYMNPGLQKVVSFWFILAGFTLTWGTLDRDLDNHESRMKFWKRRIVAIYPDFVLSTCLMFILAFFFFCSCDWKFWVVNVLGFTLIPAFIVDFKPLNGPGWFVMVYGWLVLFFPFLLPPVKYAFRNISTITCISYLLVLWLVSLLPCFFLPFDDTPGHAVDHIHISAAFWVLDRNPFFHMTEFVIGMALAVKVNEDFNQLDGDHNSGEWKMLMSVAAAPYAVIISSLIVLAYVVWRILAWSPDTNRWWADEMFPSLYAPFHMILIYGIVIIELASKEGVDLMQKGSSRQESSWAASALLKIFTWEPFVEAGKWGLPAFMFQFPLLIGIGALATVFGLGTLKTTCVPSEIFGTHHVDFFIMFHNLLWYLPVVPLSIIVIFAIGWLLSRDGPVGKHIHGWVAKVTQDK